MASSVDVKFEEICRTCMGCTQENPEDKTFQLQSVFDYVDDRIKNRKVQICDILSFSVYQLPKISTTDELPLNICTRCLEKLLACYEFQNGCIISDLRLRNLFRSVQGSPNQLQSDIDSIQLVIKQEVMFEDNNGTKPNENIDNCETNRELLENLTEETELESKVEIFENTITQKKDEQIIRHQTELESYKEVWKCKACSQCFLSRRLLLSHLENASTKCKTSIDNQTPKENNNLIEEKLNSRTINEVQTCSNVLKFTDCDNSKKSTTDKHETTNDVDKNSSRNFDTWICKFCENVFFYQVSLNRHMQLVHNKKLAEDESSGDMLEQTTKTPFTQKCDECDEVFQSLALLNLHKLNHKDPLPFKCRICNKSYRSNSYLLKHQTSHSQEQLLSGQSSRQSGPPLASDSAEIVSMDFESTAMCDQSLQQLEQQEQLFICSRCGKDFSDINSLRLHARLHDNEKRFQCLYCAKAFRTYSSVYSHQRRTHKALM